MPQHPTGTVTFLFTDIQGSTKLAREFPELWEDSRSRHHQILREAIETNNGFVFQIIGDAFCAAFYRPGEALKAACRAQQQLQNEKLVESGESKLRRDAHLEYFLDLGESAAPRLIRPEQLEWLAKLDADYENLRLALEWAQNKEAAETSLRLCAALGTFWALRGYWMEGAKWLASALTKPWSEIDNAENSFRVRAFCVDAELAELLDDLERMKTSAGQALQLAQQGSNPRDTAIAEFYVGFQLFRVMEYEQARLFLEQSLTEFQELHDPYWEASAHRWLTWLEANQGNPGVTERVQRDIELARKAGERFNLARALLDYATLLYSKGQRQEARAYFEEAKDLSKQIGSNVILSFFIQTGLALIEWRAGNRQRARTLLIEAQTRMRLLGERLSAFSCSVYLGLLSLEEGELAQAQVFFEEALSTAHALALNFLIAQCRRYLGILFFLQGHLEKSRQYLRESLALTKDLKDIFVASFLQSLFILPYVRNHENSLLVLGAIDRFEKKIGFSTDPEIRHYSIQAEAQARASLGEAAFEAAYAEGQKLSLQQALTLAQEMIEDM